MAQTKLSKGDKAKYWALMIFLGIFGLGMLFASIYTLATYPFGILTLVYGIGTALGFAFCLWSIIWWAKEYKMWLNKEKEAEKQQD